MEEVEAEQPRRKVLRHEGTPGAGISTSGAPAEAVSGRGERGSSLDETHIPKQGAAQIEWCTEGCTTARDAIEF